MDIIKNECNMCIHHTICKYESDMKLFVDRISETISKEDLGTFGTFMVPCFCKMQFFCIYRMLHTSDEQEVKPWR